MPPFITNFTGKSNYADLCKCGTFSNRKKKHVFQVKKEKEIKLCHLEPGYVGL